jgi:vacuolar-type H+-ATPase subunit F/Vma7
MARLVVVSSGLLADGFRLAGPATIETRPGREAAAALKAIVREGDVGLVLVTTDLWASVEERLRGDLERLARPVVLPIPTGGAGGGAARRQLIGEMLQRAIGFRIELRGGTS